MCLVLEATRTHRDVLYAIHMATFIDEESMLFKQVKYHLKLIISIIVSVRSTSGSIENRDPNSVDAVMSIPLGSPLLWLWDVNH